MELSNIIDRYGAAFSTQYGDKLTADQQQAIHAVSDCQTARFGEMVLWCTPCETQQTHFHSCGHRSCPRCQHHDTSRWLERQSQNCCRLPILW